MEMVQPILMKMYVVALSVLCSNLLSSSLRSTFCQIQFAREIMQLFSIGLYKLNPDGSRVLSENGYPLEAYTMDDIFSYSRAWTGKYCLVYFTPQSTIRRQPRSDLMMNSHNDRIHP